MMKTKHEIIKNMNLLTDSHWKSNMCSAIYFTLALSLKRHKVQPLVSCGTSNKLTELYKLISYPSLLKIGIIPVNGILQAENRLQISHQLQNTTNILKRKRQKTGSIISCTEQRMALIYQYQSKNREGFFKNKHSCGFIFSKLCKTLIFLMHIFSIN